MGLPVIFISEVKKITIKTPFDAVENGFAFLTEDRKQSGLLMKFFCGEKHYFSEH